MREEKKKDKAKRVTSIKPTCRSGQVRSGTLHYSTCFFFDKEKNLMKMMRMMMMRKRKRKHEIDGK